MGYTAAAWLSFGEAIATIAGALTGLLFVALSVKGNALAASRSLSSKRTHTSALAAVRYRKNPNQPAATGRRSDPRAMNRA